MKLKLKIVFLSFTILSMFYERSYALRCIKCDSTRERNCAVDPEDIDLIFITCESLLSKCAMSVVEQITYRGCSGEIFKGEYYRECEQNLCNDKIWPPGRIKCFQCEGKDCVQEQNGRAEPCVRFLEEDMCFTDFTNETYAIRGCKSDNKTLSANAIECPYNSCNYESANLY